MNRIEDKFCQSCAMPMGITDEHYGREADGTKSEDYCSYCYANGAFKKDVTMKEMLEICVGFTVDSLTTEKQARRKLERILPTLKRWADGDSDVDSD
ncbi:MAG: zinc ribbon domain-containing protein [Oscillospiraceae bacterium]|nr:zinc ribbon domain-containing protein [Oscillospiraceae bacterium]